MKENNDSSLLSLHTLYAEFENPEAANRNFLELSYRVFLNRRSLSIYFPFVYDVRRNFNPSYLEIDVTSRCDTQTALLCESLRAKKITCSWHTKPEEYEKAS
jgi:hypothetical protein